MRKTKIVCTIGPSSSNPSTLKSMVECGMNVARLNFSHGSYESFELMITALKQIRNALGVPLAILLDTKGPEIRLGTFRNGSVQLQTGSHFTLTTQEVEGTEQEAYVTAMNLWKCVKPGDRILIDDGRIELVVESAADGDVQCRVTAGGTVKDRKGVNVPYVAVDMPFLSAKDRMDLLFGIRQDVDFVAASFVRKPEDVREMRDFLRAHGGENIRIIAKIENEEGVENFDGILEEADGIMIARGDMGVEIDFRKIPGLQKSFIRKTCEAGKMSIVATQMLESMIEKNTPTRAEITDVANAVFDGTSAIMLSGETAVGKHPALVVKTMAGIAEQAEYDMDCVGMRMERACCIHRDDPLFAICDAAVTLAKDLQAKAIVAESTSGRTARGVSSFRPTQPIVAPTPSVKTYHQLALSWGVVPMLSHVQSSTDELMNSAVESAKESGCAGSGDVIVVTAGVPVAKAVTTNMLKVETIDSQ